MKQELEKVKMPKSNIKEENLANKTLQADCIKTHATKSTVYAHTASVDKSNTTVMMDKLEYSEKLASLVGDGNYNKVKKDPTLK